MWSDPSTPNGIVVSFTIIYHPINIVSHQPGTAIAQNMQQFVVDGLNGDTVYVFRVFASTRVGPGPSAETMTRTDQSSKECIYTL